MSPIDQHVLALLELGVTGLVLDHDSDYDVYILPALIPDGEPDCGPYPRLEYQVSNGLDGRRSYSSDHDTYDEAKKEFLEMVEEAKASKQPNPPFWKEVGRV